MGEEEGRMERKRGTEEEIDRRGRGYWEEKRIGRKGR